MLQGPASGGEGALFALAADHGERSEQSELRAEVHVGRVEVFLEAVFEEGLAARANADGRDVEGHRLVGVGGAALDVAGFDAEGVKGAEGGLDRRAVGGTHAGGTIADLGLHELELVGFVGLGPVGVFNANGLFEGGEHLGFERFEGRQVDAATVVPPLIVPIV